MRTKRQHIYSMLEPSAWQRPGLSPLNKLVVVFICVAAFAAIIESEYVLYDDYQTVFLAIEIVLTVAFAIEYGARLWVAGEDPRYRGFVGRVRYAITPVAIIDLLALMPLVLGLFGTEAFLLRLFRLLRILRLAKLGRFSLAMTAITEALQARRYELLMTIAIAGVLLLVSSTLLYIVEGNGQEETFGSIPRAMWWSIATLTTVGYGDAVPATGLGRVLAGLTALMGIGLIAMPTGILASAFSDAIQRHRRRNGER